MRLPKVAYPFMPRPVLLIRGGPMYDLACGASSRGLSFRRKSNRPGRLFDTAYRCRQIAYCSASEQNQHRLAFSWNTTHLIRIFLTKVLESLRDRLGDTNRELERSRRGYINGTGKVELGMAVPPPIFHRNRYGDLSVYPKMTND